MISAALSASAVRSFFDSLRRRGLHVVTLGVVALLLSALFAGTASATTPTATGSVLVTRDVAGNQNLFLRELGTGDERLLVDDLGQEHSGVFSPDGTKVAFVRETSGQADVYVVNADGSNVRRITSDDENDLNPAWGSDSTTLYFDSNRPSDGLRQIFRMNLDDLRVVTQITDSSQWENYEPSPSPDGSWVAHATSEYGVPEQYLLVQIWKTHVSTGSIAPLTQTNGKNRNPEFSPDGTKIAFSSKINTGSTGFDIWVMDAAGNNETAVTSSTFDEGAPRWVTHDGRGPARLLYVAGTASGDKDLKTIDVAGTNDGVTLGGTTNDIFGDMQPLPGCSIVWDGSAAADHWDDAANWDLGRVPQAGDKVCIPDMQSDVTVTYSTQLTTVDSIVTAEDLTVSGGALTAAAVTANPGADIRVTSGALHAPTSLTASGGTFTVAGGTSNIGALSSTGSGALTLTSGTINASTVTAAPGSPMSLNGGTLGGPVTLTSGTFTWPSSGSLSDGDPWTVAAGATVDLTDAASYWLYASLVNNGTINLNTATGIHDASGTSTLTNTATGELIKNVAASTTTISLPFDNDGLLDVVAGTVNLTGTDGSSYAASNDAGTFHTDGDDATIGFTGGRTNLGSATALTGTGRFEMTGTSTIIDLDTHGLTMPAGQTMHLTQGTLRGSGTLAGPTYKLSASVTLGTFTIHPDTTVDLTDAASYWLYDSLVNNGTINLNTATGIHDASGTSTLTNTATGELIKNVAASTTTISLPFDNDGLLDVVAGTVNLTGTDGSSYASNNDAGTFHTDGDDATIGFTGGRTNLGSATALTGTGRFEMTGTSTIIDLDTHGLTMPAGQTMHLTQGTLRGSGTLAGPTYKLSASVTLGTFTIHPDTTVDLTDAASYWLYDSLVNNGTININTATGIYDATGLSSVTNGDTGTIVKSAPNSTTGIAAPFDNQGTIRVAAGTLTLSPSMKSDGVNAFDSATGTFTGGTYEVADGAVLGFSGGLEIGTNAASFQLAGTAIVHDNTGGSVFRNLTTNLGTLEVRNGAALVTNAPLTNQGTLIVGSDATLSVPDGYTQSGVGSLTRLRDVTDNATTARLITPAATFNGGTLDGNGTVLGTVINHGAVIAPGSSPGVLTVTGDLTHAGGKLQMEIFGRNAGQFDQIDVGGAAVLTGGIQIVTQDFAPSWDDDFTLVTSPAPPTIAFATLEGANLATGLAYQPKVVNGVLTLLVTDIVNPTNVTPTTSHKPSVWSKDNTVTVNLAGASDAHSGVDGYGVVWSTSPTSTVPKAKTHEETAASVTSAPLPSGKTHYVHIRTKDNEGNWSGQKTAGPFFIDTTKPTVAGLTTPATSTSYSLTTKSTTPQVGVVWKVAKDLHSGLKSHQVLYRSTTNGRTWTSATAKLGVAATSWTTAGKPGTTYCFKVRATDKLGYASMSPERCASVPQDTASGFTTTGTWTAPTGASYYLGAARRSTALNATLSRKGVVAKQLALVATKCNGCGSVQVSLGGVAVGKAISLHTTSTTPKHKQVITLPALTGIKSGVLTVKVVKPGTKGVLIDAIGTSLR